MARIAPLAEPYPPAIDASFKAVMPPGAPPLRLFTTVARSERAWAKFRGGSLLDRGPLTLRQREIVIDRVCALNRCEYEWGVHVRAFAAKARLSREEIEATVTGAADAPCWSAAESALIAAVDALDARATLDAGEFAALSAHYDADQILEIILLAGFYRTVAYLANGLDLPLEPGAARFPAGVRPKGGTAG